MTYHSLQAAVDDATKLQLDTLKRHDVWMFADDTFEVVRFDPGDTLLGPVTMFAAGQKPSDQLTFNLPLVKNSPKYLGVWVAKDAGKDAWLGKSMIQGLTIHPNGIAEFTCSSGYAQKKGLPLDAAVPVFKPKEPVSKASFIETFHSDDTIPIDEVVHAAQAFVGAKKGQKLKPGGFGPLGGNNVASKTKASLAGSDYAEVEQHVVAHYGIDWSEEVGKFVKGAPIVEPEITAEMADGILKADLAAIEKTVHPLFIANQDLKTKADAALAGLGPTAGFALPTLKVEVDPATKTVDLKLPLYSNAKHFLGVQLDGHVVYFRKASLASWTVDSFTATMKVPLSLLKSKKLMHLVDVA